MDVYELKPDADRIGFLQITDRERRSQLAARSDGRSLLETWSPPLVTSLYDDRPLTDLLPVSSTWKALSDRAVEALADLLDGHAELLPLDGVTGYRLLHVTTVLDALDEEHSDLKRFRDGRVMRVVTYCFRADAVTAALFKIPQQVAAREYLTDTLADRVTTAGLTGFFLPAPLWSANGVSA